MSIPVDEGFEGYPATWFYLDRQAGKLSTAPPQTAMYLAADIANVSIVPRYFNAPSRATGTNAKTMFEGQGKPNAYLKVQLDQNTAGSSTKPLTYAALYPVIDNPTDDMRNTFFSDSSVGDPVQRVPLPGGTGKLRLPITAIVGGTKPKSSLLNIIGNVIGIARGSAGKALFPIPAVDALLASNIESLLNGASTAFAPETKQQYWINDGAIAVAATKSSVTGADDDVLQLAIGTSIFIVFPTGDGDEVEAAVKAILADGVYQVNVDRGGSLIATDNGSVVSPNPFANLIYVTYRATVEALS